MSDERRCGNCSFFYLHRFKAGEDLADVFSCSDLLDRNCKPCADYERFDVSKVRTVHPLKPGFDSETAKSILMMMSARGREARMTSDDYIPADVVSLLQSISAADLQNGLIECRKRHEP